MITPIDELMQGLEAVKDAPRGEGLRPAVVNAARWSEKNPQSLSLLELCFSLLDRIENVNDRLMATVDFAKEVPHEGVFKALYKRAIEAATIAADLLDESHRRTTELLRIAQSLPKTKEYLELRTDAWRLALGLPGKPRNKGADLKKLAWELPKASDEPFYTRYTLMGVAKELLDEGADFTGLYREAISTAIRAAESIEEPYFRKFSLMAIAGRLKEDERFKDLYKDAITDACKAAKDNTDPFAREHAIVDMVKHLPKTAEYAHLLEDMLDQALAFFTVRQWMGDIEVFDVVDYILSAEDTSINESKKNRYSREKYAKELSREIDSFAHLLNDTRFIPVLKPYTHVWIQPKGLRDSVKKAVERLEALTRTYHGKEIERPLFVRELNPEGGSRYISKKEGASAECIAIDLGATNTIIMRKKGSAQPDFLPLAPVSRQFDERVHIIPTVLGAETNTIGSDVHEEEPLTEIKQMLLEGNPKGREHMERFFKILYQHLKKTVAPGGWLPIMQKGPADVLYVTVPVGYADYRSAMRDIVARNAKGMRAELIEEPLAAAAGYQVVDDMDRVMMIIDFGGSTLNTMLVRVNVNEVHVISKPERAQLLGGHDIDVWLAEYLAEKAGFPKGKPPAGFVARAEEIKIGLSTENDVEFSWGGRFVSRVTREEFEEVLDAHDFYRVVDRTIGYVLKRAEKVGLKKDRIEAVLVTGGSSQIPSFKDKIGDIFPKLRKNNLIYDHSPLTAVAMGAALYGTRDISDRHLGVAYALRYSVAEKDVTHSFSIVLEKGEALPVEKTYRVRPARRLSAQDELLLEIFEVPESLIMRKWVAEGGIEFIKQELKPLGEGAALNQLKAVPVPISKDAGEMEVTFTVSASGELGIRFGVDNRVMETGLRLQ